MATARAMKTIVCMAVLFWERNVLPHIGLRNEAVAGPVNTRKKAR